MPNPESQSTIEPNPGIFGRQVLEAYRDGFDSIITRFGKEASSLMSRRMVLPAILGLSPRMH